MAHDTTLPLEHPAAKAWRQLRATRVRSERIELVRNRARSTVYRLEGAGPAGAAVIAKRSRRAQALIERTLYEQVVPLLPMPSLAYYGFVDEAEGEFAWLFIGCAGDEPYMSTSSEHTALAARWLSLLHTVGGTVAAAALLPDRGPGYFHEHLASAQRNLVLHLDNPVFSAEDRAVLEAVIGQCEALACHWSEVEQQCKALPTTLVHGDFAPKNMRVRNGQAGLVLDLFD